MRVVQVLPELNEGGVERGVVELNREFVKRGIDSCVISSGGKLVDTIKADGGQHAFAAVRSKNPLTVPTRMRSLRRLLDEINPDVIHVRSRVPAWLCRFANRKARRPVVTTVHGLNSINRYSRIMVTGDRVIAVSEVVRDYVCDAYKNDPAKVTVIQRGVDMKLFDPARLDQTFMASFRDEHGLADCIIVTSVGRVTWLKDYESFIKAIAKLAPAMTNLRGLIVGGVHPDKQAYFDRLKQLAKDSGVSDRIIFTGSQSKMPEIYALSEMVVNASLKMGNVGRTVVEALAMNTPVIATTYPGLNNLVETGRNGWIIETQDPDGLANAIEQLHQQHLPDVRSTVPAAFTLETMVEQVIGVYESVLK